MFLNFFYTLRKNGLDVSLNEWMTLMDALEKGLHNQSFTGFYHLARAIVVKSEVEFDKFDQTFVEVFKGVPYEGPVPDEVMQWLLHPKEDLQRDFADEKLLGKFGMFDDQEFEDLLRRMQETLEKQDGEHNGGSKWVGTQGRTGYGNSGWYPNGIRIGGESMHKTAMSVATERNFRDFRTDKVLDDRQYQIAFRKLRSFVSDDPFAEKVLDIEGTIEDTGNNAGVLKIRMKNPRKNAVKLLLLMDSGGTMIPYSSLLNDLFQSVNKSNHYKDVKCYYFHNCIYNHLYKTPECENGDWVETEWLFRNADSDYKVIIVGDAAMAPEELYSDTGNYRGPNGGLSGYEWLKLVKRHYKKVVWLNPKMAPGKAPWREAETACKELFPMYKLTVAGLNRAMYELMSPKR